MIDESVRLYTTILIFSWEILFVNGWEREVDCIAWQIFKYQQKFLKKLVWLGTLWYTTANGHPHL